VCTARRSPASRNSRRVQGQKRRFGEAQIWSFRNGTTWTPLHPLSSEGFVLADRDDGTGTDELIVDFGAAGLWQYSNDSIWTQLDGASPENLTAGRYH
jgi:hypothetical protein